MMNGRRTLYVVDVRHVTCDERYLEDCFPVEVEKLEYYYLHTTDGQKLTGSEFIWFNREEDAQAFINDVKTVPYGFNSVTLENFDGTITAVDYSTFTYDDIRKHMDVAKTVRYYGNVKCEDCEKLFVPTENNILYDRHSEENSYFCDKCIDEHYVCDMCGSVEKYDPDFDHDGYCSDCY